MCENKSRLKSFLSAIEKWAYSKEPSKDIPLESNEDIYTITLSNGMVINLNKRAVDRSRAIHENVDNNPDIWFGRTFKRVTYPYAYEKPGGCDDDSCKWCHLYRYYSPLIPANERNDPNTYKCKSKHNENT